MRRRTRLACLCTLALPLTLCGATRNIVPNSGFEKGRDAPENWTPPDGLTVFWESDGPSGRYLHLDTDVYRREWEQNRLEPGSVRKKTPTSGKKYDTVGGSVGVAVYSYPIRVPEPGWYLVEYDVRGPGGEPFVYLKGYKECTADEAARRGELIFFRPDPDGPSFSLMVMGGVGEEKRPPKPGDYLQLFRRRFVTRFPKNANGRWCRCEGIVDLTQRPVEVVLLELYAFWPPGDYCFDNVRMRRITDKEAEEYNERKKRDDYEPVRVLDSD